MNRLSQAISSYLLQHKSNPVNWYPWSDDAFAEARERDLPIFLSIGYAACHWCHVMAHESFENPEVAAYLNAHFIAIKVDREERPDIDNLYMQAVTALTGHGGWPLSVFLTPDGKPFFGGTYFPHPPRYGQIGFLPLLQHLTELWQNNRHQLTDNSQVLSRYLQKKIGCDSSTLLSWSDVVQRSAGILNIIDFSEGGLQGSPKFPQIPLWQWLFTLGIYSNQHSLVDACYLTAEKLCQGGIFDHLGGGWMRYSTDERWLVPHFEKMLYDNAMIIEWLSMLQAYRPHALFAQRIEETVEWLLAEMLLKEGTFAASIDADSEGQEGRFYVWNYAELKAHLGKQAKPFLDYYGGTPKGNWEGTNILHRNHTQESSLSDEELEYCKEKLVLIRQKRVAPARDDITLLDWNALTIAALARASFTLNRPDWLTVAKFSYDSLQQLLYKEEQWQHCYRAGQSAHPAMLEDYANIIYAAIHLYLVTGEDNYLQDARSWQAQAELYFNDATNHLYSQVSKNAPGLLANPQPLQDTPMPSGNGMMAINLSLLHLLTGETHYEQRLQSLLTTLFEVFKTEQYIALCSIYHAIAWYTHGVKLQGNFKKVQQIEGLLGHIPPLIATLQDTAQTKFQYCNARECLADGFDESALLKLLKSK